MYANFYLDENNYIHPRNKRELIGRGRFGEVYKVIGTDGGVYALREIRAEEGKDDQHLFREIELFAIVKSHPAICKLVGYFIGARKTLILDYMPNKSLAQLLETVNRYGEADGWTPTNRSKMVIGFATAMMHLHSFNIVHRYLTPRNIMFDSRWNPKLTDFGFARTIPEYDINVEGAMTVINTNDNDIWSAPEAITQDSYDNKVDVYAFGMILFCIVTGQKMPSLKRRRATGIKETIVQGGRPVIPDDCHECLRQIIEACWSQQPHNRPEFSEIVRMIVELDEPMFPGTNMDEYRAYVEDVMAATNSAKEIYEIYKRSTLNPADKRKFEEAYARLDEANPRTFLKVADMLQRGIGTPIDEEAAAVYYEKAAKLGDRTGMYCIARCYKNGIGVQPDMNKAYEWMRQASDRRYPIAVVGCAIMLEQGIGCERNPDEAFRMFQEMANPPYDMGIAQYHFARMCDQTKEDFPTAREYYTRARNKGHEGAVCDLAKMSLEGRGCPVDIPEALRLYELAAAQSFGIANYNLGIIFQKGLYEQAIDDARASEHFKKSAEQGCLLGMVKHAGTLIQAAKKAKSGDAKIQDMLSDAVYYLEIAADAGNSVAQFNFGKLLLEGRGIEKDETRALKYLQAAAKGGAVPAMLLLGDIFCGTTPGPKTNRKLGRMYYRAVLKKGNPDQVKQANDALLTLFGEV